MPGDRKSAITSLLMAIREDPTGGSALHNELYDTAYPHLQRIARRMLNGESGSHTLQPTALVHEAYLSLVDQTRADWKNRAQFLSVAARIMRRILVDHARRKRRAKRGGELTKVTLSQELPDMAVGVLDVLALEDILAQLEGLDARTAGVVEQRIFGGMTMEEIAESLGVSVRTVQDDWSFARRWLARHMDGSVREGP